MNSKLASELIKRLNNLNASQESIHNESIYILKICQNSENTSLNISMVQKYVALWFEQVKVSPNTPKHVEFMWLANDII